VHRFLYCTHHLSGANRRLTSGMLTAVTAILRSLHAVASRADTPDGAFADIAELHASLSHLGKQVGIMLHHTNHRFGDARRLGCSGDDRVVSWIGVGLRFHESVVLTEPVHLDTVILPCWMRHPAASGRSKQGELAMLVTAEAPRCSLRMISHGGRFLDDCLHVVKSAC
jgi:hypothetical protein